MNLWQEGTPPATLPEVLYSNKYRNKILSAMACFKAGHTSKKTLRTMATIWLCIRLFCFSKSALSSSQCPEASFGFKASTFHQADFGPGKIRWSFFCCALVRTEKRSSALNGGKFQKCEAICSIRVCPDFDIPHVPILLLQLHCKLFLEAVSMTRKALFVVPGCVKYVEPWSLDRIVDIQNGKAADDSKRQRPQIRNEK